MHLTSARPRLLTAGRRPLVTAALVVVTAALAASCSAPSDATPAATAPVAADSPVAADPTTTPSPATAPDDADRSGGGPVGSDLATVTDRLPSLKDATGARWTGDASTWFDAVVDCPEGSASTLHALYGTEPSDGPEVAAALSGELPDGPWESSPELAQAMSTGEWTVESAFLAPGSDQLVLRAVAR